MNSQKEGGYIRPFFLECSSQLSSECTMSYVWILLASEVPEALLRDLPAQQTFSTLPVSLFTLLCVFSYRSSYRFLKARRFQKASLCYPSCPSQSMFLASLCPTPREPLSLTLAPLNFSLGSPLLHSPTPVPSPPPPKDQTC